MKIALQIHLIPGDSVSDRCKWARDHGVDGIELIGAPHDRLCAEAEQVLKVLPVTTLCGAFDEHGDRCFDLLDADIEKRRRAVAVTSRCLELAGQFGAVGLILPPIFGPPVVPDLSPFADPLEIEDALMVAHCRELGAHAVAHDTLLLLEPLNRYEQHYLKQQSDAVRVIDKAAAAGVALLSDLFHMHIEETDTPAALCAVAGRYTKSIHLADNTRCEPGTGDIDFVAAFKALFEVGYDGYMAYECAITGDDDEQKKANLARSLTFVRKCVEEAGGATSHG
jgi:sugar phosphate isomerase/epimerase